MSLLLWVSDENFRDAFYGSLRRPRRGEEPPDDSPPGGILRHRREEGVQHGAPAEFGTRRVRLKIRCRFKHFNYGLSHEK